jgi:hypothetical protein
MTTPSVTALFTAVLIDAITTPSTSRLKFATALLEPDCDCCTI